MYQPHTNLLYRPHTNRLTHWPHTSHIPNTCWLPLPTTYWPDQLVHYTKSQYLWERWEGAIMLCNKQSPMGFGPPKLARKILSTFALIISHSASLSWCGCYVSSCGSLGSGTPRAVPHDAGSDSEVYERVGSRPDKPICAGSCQPGEFLCESQEFLEKGEEIATFRPCQKGSRRTNKSRTKWLWWSAGKKQHRFKKGKTEEG